MLDPGGYGSVSITKSIYINGTHGAGYGSILNPLVTGVSINITDALDVRKAVRLRALDINGVSTGANGVSIFAANNVWIEDSVIDGNTGNGTTRYRYPRGDHRDLQPLCLGHGDSQARHRYAVTPSAARSREHSNSNIEGNTTGLDVTTGGFATVQDTRFAANSTNGVVTSSGATATLRDNIFSNNGTAINAGAGTTVRSLSNILNNNTTGFGGTTAVIQTDGQNKSIANGGGGPGGGLVTIN